ncbi:hypothetical protein C4577_06880 [Candidatus Parcubacteria bacterium]|nr:MAG: hypothetical protein C4577_06880 [Candidatus Parcubacteria bacterium]
MHNSKLIRKFSKPPYPIILVVSFYLLWTSFWLNIFNNNSSPIPKKTLIEAPIPKSFSAPNTQTITNNHSKKNLTLKATPSIEKKESQEIIPLSFKINLPSRKQVYNLSCEFAASAAIIYYFSNFPDFSPQNELSAEKTLISQVPQSENPNIGIRMGALSPSKNMLYTNLNQVFGGTEYYGVHAGPLIDLFSNYNLNAVPIYANQELSAKIKKAISSKHLIIAWIHSSRYNSIAEVILSYANAIPLVPGEHSVVINGYDQNGAYYLDPADGKEKYVDFETLTNLSKNFPIPFLEVYPSLEENSISSFRPSYPIDKQTGLDRRLFSIKIENASQKTGEATKFGVVLKMFDYNIKSIENSTDLNTNGLIIKTKPEKRDFIYLLKKDLEFASLPLPSIIEYNLDKNEPFDAILIVGN